MAAKVTNKKLAGSGDTWAPFAGWSVLFDRPTEADLGELSLLHLSPPDLEAEPVLAELAPLAGALDSACGRLHPIVPVPASTFHVTVCDGIADDTVARANKNDGELRRLLDGLPEALFGWNHALPYAGELADLLAAADEPVELAVTGIDARGHAIVAALEPTPASREAYDSISAARTALTARVGDEYGVDIATPWQPHVTLAYITNRRHGRAVAACLKELAPPLVERLAGESLGFRRASLYAFDDMVTYWRIPPSSDAAS